MGGYASAFGLDILNGALLEASQHNVHLVVCSTSNDQAQEANVLQSLMESGIKGIIIQPVPVSYTHLSPGEGIPADRLSPA